MTSSGQPVDPASPESFWQGRMTMVGLITERDLDQAEEAFPGIMQFFSSLARKPRTFLELVWWFYHPSKADQAHSVG
jgi:hypothetical protein